MRAHVTFACLAALGDGLDGLARAPASNTFLVRMSYWFSL
jgi:hypothetical protein